METVETVDSVPMGGGKLSCRPEERLCGVDGDIQH